MNRKFGKLVNGRLVCAPNMVAHDGRSYINPKESDYLKADDGPWYPIESLPPPSTPPAEGYHYSRNGWVFDEELKRIVPGYVQIENPPPLPPPPRVFSKMRVVAALMSAGIWPQVKQWIEASGYYDLYLAAQDFREDDPYFKEGLAALKAQLGISDSDVEHILHISDVDYVEEPSE